jgi:hypothetical protein
MLSFELHKAVRGAKLLAEGRQTNTHHWALASGELTVRDDRENASYLDEEDVFTSLTKYHRPSCHMIEKVRRRNFKRLKSWKSAVALGLEPCGICNPFYIPRAAPLAATQQPEPIQVVDAQPASMSQAPVPIELPAIPGADVQEWRRRIAQALSRLDQTADRPRDEGLAAQLGRLSRQNVIPRSVAAMMRAIAELRNEVEHESQVLSQAKQLAAWGNWVAIQEWASSEGLPI